MRKMRMIQSSLAALSLAGCLPVLAQTQWNVTKTLHIGGQGGWDYVTVDAAEHRLFVTRSMHTMVIDSETGKTLGDIAGLWLSEE